MTGDFLQYIYSVLGAKNHQKIRSRCLVHKFCIQNLTKERKQPPVNALWQAIFYNIFILCLGLRIIWRYDQGVYFMNFHSQMFFYDINLRYTAAILKKNSLWLLPFYMSMATFCFYEMVRKTMRTAIVSYLHKYENLHQVCIKNYIKTREKTSRIPNDIKSLRFLSIFSNTL